MIIVMKKYLRKTLELKDTIDLPVVGKKPAIWNVQKVELVIGSDSTPDILLCILQS